MALVQYRVVSIRVAALALAALAVAVPETSARSMIFGGGPFYSGGPPMMNTLRSSGFHTVMIWAIHVNGTNGDLTLNDHLVVRDGQYVGRPEWPGELRSLKQSPTSVSRIEISVGSAGPDDWREIERLINAQGTGSSSILFRNFQVLANLPGIDAFNSDDEAHYNVATHVAFGRMVAGMGKRFTLCPYTNGGFWRQVKQQLGGIVDRIYVQHYAGGGGNHPSGWNAEMGMPIEPGLWSRHGEGNCNEGDSPAEMRSRFSDWRRDTGIPGGWVWLADDVLRCLGTAGFGEYARAINSVFGDGPGPTPSPTPTEPTGAVRVFQHCDYTGWGAGFGGTGHISTAQIQSAGGRDNDASSLRIAPGFRVTLFDGNNQTGRSIVLTSDTPCLVAPGFNDLLSSISIESGRPTPTPSPGNGVVFFEHTGFGGAGSQPLGPGTYRLAELVARGVPNDWASSARVPAGRMVTLFQHDNFMGTQWTIGSNTPSFVPIGANDQMSSCRVQ
jgi:hypothetical protein